MSKATVPATVDTIGVFKSAAAAIYSGTMALSIVNAQVETLRKGKIVFGKSVKSCTYRVQLNDAMQAAFVGKAAKTYSNYVTAFVAAVNEGAEFSFSHSKGKAAPKGAKGKGKATTSNPNQPRTQSQAAQETRQATPPASNTQSKKGASNRFQQMENEVQRALAVMDKDTERLLNYRQLIRNPKYKKDWNKFGRLSQGVGGRIKGKNTIKFIYKRNVPREQFKDVTYGKFVCTERPEKTKKNHKEHEEDTKNTVLQSRNQRISQQPKISPRNERHGGTTNILLAQNAEDAETRRNNQDKEKKPTSNCSRRNSQFPCLSEIPIP
jgi:hypothetical protein